MQRLPASSFSSSQYTARDAIIATGLFISEINHVTRGSSSFHGFAGKRRSQGQISRHFYFGCKLILALALEFVAGLWHLEKHLLRSIQRKLRTLIFFSLDILFAGVFFTLRECKGREGGRMSSQTSCFLPLKPLTSLLAPCSSLLGVQTFDLLSELETTELPRGDIKDMG